MTGTQKLCTFHPSFSVTKNTPDPRSDIPASHLRTSCGPQLSLLAWKFGQIRPERKTRRMARNGFAARPFDDFRMTSDSWCVEMLQRCSHSATPCLIHLGVASGTFKFLVQECRWVLQTGKCTWWIYINRPQNPEGILMSVISPKAGTKALPCHLVTLPGTARP